MLRGASENSGPAPAFLRLGRKYSLEIGPGLLASLFLHGLILGLILWLFLRTEQAQKFVLSVVPVDVVRIGEVTQSPPAPHRSLVPQQKARYQRQEAQSPNPPAGTTPYRAKPVDELDAKLRGLARLKQPQTNLKIVETPAASDVDSTSDSAEPGSEATYAVKDFVRAQVLRRWGLNLHMLAGKSYIIPIHVVIKPDGVVAKAEIVDRERYSNDAAYRSIALSCRNALLLASPIAFPEGAVRHTMEFTLNFNPHDALQ
jgi:hypothetical protein